MKKVLVLHSDNSGSGHLRVIEPYSKLNIPGFCFDIRTSIPHGKYDAILFQRPLLPWIPNYILASQKEGVKIIVETDDAVELLDETNPYYKYHQDKTDTYLECMQLADYIHVSTPDLITYPEKTHVFLNAIDFTKYHAFSVPGKHIMWAGSRSHMHSIEMIKPVLLWAMQYYPVLLMSDGSWLQSMFPPHKNLTIASWTSFESYCLEPARAKVFLCPLPDTPFNRRKSEIKCLEAAVFGVPCITSKIEPYERWGTCLFEDWQNNIMLLMDSPIDYQMYSEAALLAVRERYNLATINKRREAFWKHIFDE